jgi:hypothetical protein
MTKHAIPKSKSVPLNLGSGLEKAEEEAFQSASNDNLFTMIRLKFQTCLWQLKQNLIELKSVPAVFFNCFHTVHIEK